MQNDHLLIVYNIFLRVYNIIDDTCVYSNKYYINKYNIHYTSSDKLVIMSCYRFKTRNTCSAGCVHTLL